MCGKEFAHVVCSGRDKLILQFIGIQDAAGSAWLRHVPAPIASLIRAQCDAGVSPCAAASRCVREATVRKSCVLAAPAHNQAILQLSSVFVFLGRIHIVHSGRRKREHLRRVISYIQIARSAGVKLSGMRGKPEFCVDRFIDTLIVYRSGWSIIAG